MSNQWLRLWHDMPNDPKWRTIARASKQPITAVISVYLHVLVDASANADERGQTHSLNSEDVASALDLEVEQAEAILAAMQGRVLEGKTVTGWEKRQPKREDDSAARAKAWRDSKKNAIQPQSNAERTQPNAQERPDTDTDTELKPKNHSASADAATPISASKKTLSVNDLIALNIDGQVAADFLVIRKAKKAPLTQTALDGIRAEAVKAAYTLEMALRECVARGWQGFKAEWVTNRSQDSPRRTPSVNQLPTNYGKSGVL